MSDKSVRRKSVRRKGVRRKNVTKSVRRKNVTKSVRRKSVRRKNVTKSVRRKSVRRIYTRRRKRKIIGGEKFRGSVRGIWIPDKDAICSVCRGEFNLIKRKHHCRNCGNVVHGKPCSMMSTLLVGKSLTKASTKKKHFIKKNEEVRICNKCHEILNIEKNKLTSKVNSADETAKLKRDRMTENDKQMYGEDILKIDNQTEKLKFRKKIQLEKLELGLNIDASYDDYINATRNNGQTSDEGKTSDEGQTGDERQTTDGTGKTKSVTFSDTDVYFSN